MKYIKISSKFTCFHLSSSLPKGSSMKNLIRILFVISSCFVTCEQLFSQGRPASGSKINISEPLCELDENQGTELAALLDVGIKRQKGEFSVFGAGENTRNGANNQYRYIPKFRIVEVTDFSSLPNPYITIEFAPIEIDPLDIKNLLKSQDPRVSQTTSISAAQVYALGITYPSAINNGAKICATGGLFLDHNCTFNLLFKTSQDAKTAAKNIKTYGRNSGIAMYSTAYYKFTTEDFLRTSLKKLMNSDAYREFVRTVEGEKISVLQKNAIKSIIQSTFETSVKVESADSKYFIRYFDQIFDQIINPKEVVIPFRDAASMLSDFVNDPAYATNVLEQMAIDSYNMSDEQWKKTYTKDRLEDIVKNAAWGGGGGVGYKGFKIGGNATNKKEFKETVHDIINTEDSGRKIFQDMFKYNWQGKKYSPKGITANEVIKVNSVEEIIRVMKFEFYTNAFRTIPISIE